MSELPPPIQELCEQLNKRYEMLEDYRKFLETELYVATGIKWTFEKYEERVNHLKERFHKSLTKELHT